MLFVLDCFDEFCWCFCLVVGLCCFFVFGCWSVVFGVWWCFCFVVGCVFGGGGYCVGWVVDFVGVFVVVLFFVLDVVDWGWVFWLGVVGVEWFVCIVGCWVCVFCCVFGCSFVGGVFCLVLCCCRISDVKKFVVCLGWFIGWMKCDLGGLGVVELLGGVCSLCGF